jgi:hypothetical protein
MVALPIPQEGSRRLSMVYARKARIAGPLFHPFPRTAAARWLAL